MFERFLVTMVVVLAVALAAQGTPLPKDKYSDKSGWTESPVIEPTKDGVKVRFADFEGTAEKADYDKQNRTLTLTGSVQLTQPDRPGQVKRSRGTMVFSGSNNSLKIAIDESDGMLVFS